MLVLHNAKALFRPGLIPTTGGTGLEVHSAIISCNEDGFHLTKNNVPMPSKTGSGICSKRQTLFCREGEGGLGTWVDESGHLTFGKDITCKKGLTKKQKFFHLCLSTVTYNVLLNRSQLKIGQHDYMVSLF